jgi:mannobiose 2-epimerase
MTLREARDRTRDYLQQTLLPFWIKRSPDLEYGGFLTYFDAFGRPTGETRKTFLMQIRMLYTMSSAHRSGYGDGRCGELAEQGARFILDHYWDEEHGGWIWIADQTGRPLVRDKVGYGQCFGLYAFSEYALATGDPRGREAADRTFEAISTRMSDRERGGVFELMQGDWSPVPGGRSGGDRKSFDVHMHLMEALTAYYELTGEPDHRGALEESITLLRGRMLHPSFGLGWMQFTLDFQPLPAILFDVQWGRDAEPEDGPSRPIEYTSYGHKREFVWLLLLAYDGLGRARSDAGDVVRPIVDHAVEFGIDREFGGLYVEGPMDAATRLYEKQFWQQAEAMVGFLDALALFGDPRYREAFQNILEFVFSKFIASEGGGEWYERLDRAGRPIDDALGHEWKISYHTVRSMIQVVRRLDELVATSESGPHHQS